MNRSKATNAGGLTRRQQKLADLAPPDHDRCNRQVACRPGQRCQCVCVSGHGGRCACPHTGRFGRKRG